MNQHKPTAYLPPSSPYSEECRTCGLEWPCPAEIARRRGARLKRGLWFVPLLIVALAAIVVGCSWFAGAW